MGKDSIPGKWVAPIGDRSRLLQMILDFPCDDLPLRNRSHPEEQ
jgi:hypothetical protein